VPVQVFTTPTASLASTSLNQSYWLPVPTLTWDMNDQMKFRLSESKTIARPQFRELIFQNFYDTDSNRLFRGNPLLTDSQLYNAEACWIQHVAVILSGTLHSFVGGSKLSFGRHSTVTAVR
jgi:outer membrane receptor protein involved in Fe transport